MADTTQTISVSSSATQVCTLSNKKGKKRRKECRGSKHAIDDREQDAQQKQAN